MHRTLLLLIASFGLSSGQFDPHFVENRTTMVHLFEWRWKDIAEECERFLAGAGFGGVQVSPPNENVMFSTTGDIRSPWYERYQPVSYRLETRSGNETEFQDMVKRCNEVGVRIYVDAVINHMSGQWPKGTKSSGGSEFDGTVPEYPGVPFSPKDFHGNTSCQTKSGNIENYSDSNQVRNCKLVGLNDLDHSKPHVQEVLVEYLNRLIKYGVAGFRIDAAKHIWPKEMEAILNKLNNLSTEFSFENGSRPFIYQEVIDLGSEPISSQEYTHIGRVTEFKYGIKLANVFRKNDQAKWLQNFGKEWGLLDSQKAFVFIDNHDNQRGHGGGGQVLTFRAPRTYKIAVAFMLAWPYGVPRIMSSYYWEQKMTNGKDANDWIGPPHDKNYNTLNVTIKNDFTCANGWVCEHRWKEIYKMVEFRNIVGDAPKTNWWDNGLNQIAFERSERGFIAINNDDFPMIQNLNTTMAPGTYCDIISGGLKNGICEGNSLTVADNGSIKVSISNAIDNPMIAIHIKEKLL